jgi:divalent metal cation (Fe/Co/Zn/Cd) transporter
METSERISGSNDYGCTPPARQPAYWPGVVTLTAAASLLLRVRPEASCLGIGITVAALFVMPLLVWGKRRVAKATNNRALAADAVQSATCAYLAELTIGGLAFNALFHIHWVGSVAALAAIPILVIEGRRAMRGEGCGSH